MQNILFIPLENLEVESKVFKYCLLIYENLKRDPKVLTRLSINPD
jgi:hypothetical protein